VRPAISSFQATQTAALFIGTEDLFSTFFRIGMGWRILPTLFLTGTTEIVLLPVGRSTVPHKRVALAMWTMNDDGDHGTFNLVYP
jgi:hypothetical protein